MLPPKLVPATFAKDDLHRHSDRASEALRCMTCSSGDDERDQSLWTKTLSGVGKVGCWVHYMGRADHGCCIFL